MASTAMEGSGPPPPDTGSSFDVGSFRTYISSLLLPGKPYGSDIYIICDVYADEQ
jgi:hypothetical protein